MQFFRKGKRIILQTTVFMNIMEENQNAVNNQNKLRKK